MAAFSSLKDHPFAVEAYFNRSVVFTFAAPKAELERFLPECLSLDTFKDTYGFIAVAMVDTRDLRPKGTSKLLGIKSPANHDVDVASFGDGSA